MEKRITAKEAAKYLGLNPSRFSKVKKYIGRVRLPSETKPKYTYKELDAFMARCYEPPAPIENNKDNEEEVECQSDIDTQSRIINLPTGTRTSQFEASAFASQLDNVLGI